MNQQLNPFSQGFDLSRKLWNQALSGFEELVSLEFDHAQEFLGHSTKQLKAVMSEPGQVDELSQLPDAVQQGAHGIINLARDTAIAVTDYQIDTLRVLQNQSSEMQKTISAAFAEQVSWIQSTVSDEAQPAKTAASARKVAA